MTSQTYTSPAEQELHLVRQQLRESQERHQRLVGHLLAAIETAIQNDQKRANDEPQYAQATDARALFRYSKMLDFLVTVVHGEEPQLEASLKELMAPPAPEA